MIAFMPPRRRESAAPDAARIVGLLMARMRDFPTTGLAEVHNGRLTQDGARLEEMHAAVSLGSLAAFVDALIYCHERRIAPPLWMPAAAITFAVGWRPAIDYLPRGRGANPMQWQRSVLVKRARYEAVQHLMRLRADLRDFPDRMVADELRRLGATHPEVQSALARQKAADPIVPAPGVETYQIAERMLAHSGAAGGADVIRKDFELVRARFAEFTTAAYYFPEQAVTLELLGWPDLIGACDVGAPLPATVTEDSRQLGANSGVAGGAQLLNRSGSRP
jgi:hypothetical protein